MSIVPFKVHDPFDFYIWDPFQSFSFGILGANAPHFSNEAATFVNPRIDWTETPEAHVFKAHLPGLGKDEVKVELEHNNDLCITGERNVQKEEKTGNWHRVEHCSGKFLRRFRLPENAQVEKMKAKMEHGVLTITIPKGQMKKNAKLVHVS